MKRKVLFADSLGKKEKLYQTDKFKLTWPYLLYSEIRGKEEKKNYNWRKDNSSGRDGSWVAQ